MSEPVNNIGEIIEGSSENKFDMDYKKVMVINKCMVLVTGWNDMHQEKDLWCIYLLKVVLPFPLFTLSVAQHSEGSTMLTFSGQHFHTIFMTKA